MVSDERKLYYFAHPYTVRDASGQFVPAGEEANFRLCAIRSARLLQAGVNIYSPITHTHPIHIACPEFLAAAEHNLWYTLDNQIIDRMRWDGIIMAPGWEGSGGCRAERARFEALGLPVLLYGDIVSE